jgi:hypothetical protein
MTFEEVVLRLDVLEKQMRSILISGVKKIMEKDIANSDSDETPKQKKTSGYLMYNASQRPAVKEAMEKEIANKLLVILEPLFKCF